MRLTSKGALLMAGLAVAGSACHDGGPSARAQAGEVPAAAAPSTSAPSAATRPWSDFFAHLAEQAGESSVVTGTDGWLFFAPELRHLGLGPFWGPDAAAVSRAPDSAQADPVAAIVDFDRQLEAAGIDLLFVPVPAKAAIYSERLPGDVPGTVEAGDRADLQDRAVLDVLAEAGIAVLDLAPVFLAAKDAGSPLYCRTDTHWSPRGIAVASEAIVARIGERVGSSGALEAVETEERSIEIAGDLWQRLAEPRPPKESLAATFLTASGGSFPVDRASPVLLLGDSHALVFHAGQDLHAEHAGLPEHLAWRLGRGVDLIAVRGSGATPARVNLLRRGDALAGKKVVVWVISVREYTEGQGWAEVPITR